MMVLLQRVSSASVSVLGEVTGAIDQGLLMFACAEPGDTASVADKLIVKVLKLRIFADDQGKMNRSLVDVRGGLLVISQFTLAADVWSGNRPSFTAAADPSLGKLMYERLLETARSMHSPVMSGVFGADMQVRRVNDGPVTIPMTLRS